MNLLLDLHGVRLALWDREISGIMLDNVSMIQKYFSGGFSSHCFALDMITMLLSELEVLIIHLLPKKFQNLFQI